MDLMNKVAIVTGSARGIGREIALKLAEVGANVVVNDIPSAAEALEEVVKEIESLGRQSMAITADVSSPEDVARMVESVVSKLGRVDILVNNAGVTRDGIVSIASIVGIHGNAGQANYAAAKAGVIAFTKSVAKEVASRGITVNAIAPGYIDTKMTQNLDEKQSAELLKRVPMGYAGTPRDVAEAVAFLASEEARYITGQVLGVDGGM
jgi:3-oxoacyl-[acyl-carrier protein] reductase